MFGKRSLLPLFILVALVMSACGGSNNAATSTKFSGTIHIASSTWTGYALIYLANSKGIWKNHGLAVNFKDVVGKRPVALLIATPALCQSRVCGR